MLSLTTFPSKAREQNRCATPDGWLTSASMDDDRRMCTTHPDEDTRSIALRFCNVVNIVSSEKAGELAANGPCVVKYA